MKVSSLLRWCLPDFAVLTTSISFGVCSSIGKLDLQLRISSGQDVCRRTSIIRPVRSKPGVRNPGARSSFLGGQASLRLTGTTTRVHWHAQQIDEGFRRTKEKGKAGFAQTASTFLLLGPADAVKAKTPKRQPATLRKLSLEANIRRRPLHLSPTFCLLHTFAIHHPLAGHSLPPPSPAVLRRLLRPRASPAISSNSLRPRSPHATQPSPRRNTMTPP